jgi:hypothetical protein
MSGWISINAQQAEADLADSRKHAAELAARAYGWEAAHQKLISAFFPADRADHGIDHAELAAAVNEWLAKRSAYPDIRMGLAQGLIARLEAELAEARAETEKANAAYRYRCQEYTDLDIRMSGARSVICSMRTDLDHMQAELTKARATLAKQTEALKQARHHIEELVVPEDSWKPHPMNPEGVVAKLEGADWDTHRAAEEWLAATDKELA